MIVPRWLKFWKSEKDYIDDAFDGMKVTLSELRSFEDGMTALHGDIRDGGRADKEEWDAYYRERIVVLKKLKRQLGEFTSQIDADIWSGTVKLKAGMKKGFKS